MSVFKHGDRIELFGKELRVCATPEGLQDCNQCQVHHLCSRNYADLKNFCAKHNCASCTELIGQRFHFKILE
jgi:hypothetical protein